MRKMFHMGSALGLCFKPENIDLSVFTAEPLGAVLPDGRVAYLRQMEIVFYKPNYSDPFDCGAHRASVVNLKFCDQLSKDIEFEVSGAYFWRFLESVPEDFRILTNNNTKESYINDSLEVIMMAARYAYQTCFVDTTMENTCVPPLSCSLDFETGDYSVIEAMTLPEDERRLISGLVNEKLNQIDLTVFANEFVDNMLIDGYLIHGFKSVEGGISPKFTAAKWSKTKHKNLSDYLCELSPHTYENCPAYIRWSEFLNTKLQNLVKKLFDELFTIDTLKGKNELTEAQMILENDGNLFEIQGANESVDAVYDRAIIVMGQYMESLEHSH
ncbi:MAG: hypothetical protein V7722_06520 [Porticoccus sp.]